jgi:hypothetical protein
MIIINKLDLLVEELCKQLNNFSFICHSHLVLKIETQLTYFLLLDCLIQLMNPRKTLEVHPV